MSDNRSRQPRGVPVGGQFATEQRMENDDMPEYGADFYIEDDTDYSSPPKPLPVPQKSFEEPDSIVTGESSGMIEQYPHSRPPQPQNDRKTMDAKRIHELTTELTILLATTPGRPNTVARVLELTEQISYHRQRSILPDGYDVGASEWVRGLEADLNEELLPLNSRVSVLEVKRFKNGKVRAEIAAIYLRRAEILGIFRAHRDRESQIMEMR